MAGLETGSTVLTLSGGAHTVYPDTSSGRGLRGIGPGRVAIASGNHRYLELANIIGMRLCVP